MGQNGKEKVQPIDWKGQAMHRSRPGSRRIGLFLRFILFSFAVTASLPHAFIAMGTRREARERAVQFLFQYDLNPPDVLEGALDLFWESQHQAAISDQDRRTALRNHEELPPPSVEEAAVRVFADPLIRGVVAHRDELDTHIRKHVRNWELHRIAVVDRNILRLAIFEMLHREDIPPVVSINEAVDIAKRFSTEDSGKFVNGILDKIKSELMRPARIIP
jgi:transcription antitermination protein NusB